MATLDIHFILPTDGRELNVEVEDTITPAEVISNLISADFVVVNPQGYKLNIKGGAELHANKSFREAGVENGCRIKVIPATDAGFRPSTN